jgi:cell wall-associated NlpC family hydrolase
MRAYEHAGVGLPHNTVAMLDSGKLRWEPRSQARWGDLVMWGGSSPFHVELFAGWNGERTFGAHDSGTRVGFMWYGGWWYANENFYRVV